MRSPGRTATVALLAVLAALLVPTAASAKSYVLPRANVQVRVEANGSLRVEERITFSFSGPFSGAYRDIPLRPGEALTDLVVLEGGKPYAPGACIELGCDDVAGSFGVTRVGDDARVVWHYRATDEERTFEVRYRLRGVAVAYDDVVDVNLKVWGDEWPVGLSQLVAVTAGPGKVAKSWGHPVWVRGDVELRANASLLRALGVPSGQWVEQRTLYPRSAFTSTTGMRVVQGKGLAKIVAEEQADAAAYERDKERIDDAVAHPGRSALIVLLLGVLPALAVVAAVYWRFGRELDTGYDREYEQEPPTDLQPALVPVLISEGGGVGSFEFTATLFDLVRRGRYQAVPATTERPIWAGLRHELVHDLELSAGDDAVPLTAWEQNVAKVVDDVLDGGSERLSRFRERIAADREAMSKRFSSFKENVAKSTRDRGWFTSGGGVPLGVAALVFGALGALMGWQAIDGWRTVYPRWSDVVLLALAVASFMNLVIVVVALGRRKLWRRRSREAVAESQRWEAFRRYLSDFPRLHDAPPASLALWERYLVYGIALGIADRVLQAAHLHMPEELAEQSSIYWISPTGDLGSGATSISIGDLSSGFGSALAPPSSGSGGGGGGFSGGGGRRRRGRRRRRLVEASLVRAGHLATARGVGTLVRA